MNGDIMQAEKHYNIMTSCDEKLLAQMSVLIYSISANLNDAVTDFYLLHRGIDSSRLGKIDALCRKLDNVIFHSIVVPDVQNYDFLASYGGSWAGEAYFSLCAHTVLPESIDRILYVDAGDVMVTGDIADFYHYDFGGRTLIVHPARWKIQNDALVEFEPSDLKKTDGEDSVWGIVRGLFNSGSYMMNIKKMREDGLSMEFYFDVVDRLKKICGAGRQNLYWGDQGLLSAAFVGDIRCYRSDEIRNIWYMPYNFCLWYYRTIPIKPAYRPAVVHFVPDAKPWQVKYPVYTKRFQEGYELISIEDLKTGMAEWYYLWHEYAVLADRMLECLEDRKDFLKSRISPGKTARS